MLVLIGNTVKTDVTDHVCRTREEAEALYLALKSQTTHEPASAKRVVDRHSLSRAPRLG